MVKTVAEPVANIAVVQEPLIVTATELKQNLSKYLKIAQKRDVLITKNGRTVNKLVNMQEERWQQFQTLIGAIKGAENITDKELDEMRYQCLKEKYAL